MKVRWICLLSLITVASVWSGLMVVDAVWAAQDRRARLRCDRAMEQYPARPGEKMFPHLFRVCSTPETVGSGHVMRDHCFHGLTRGYCERELWREYLRSGSDVSMLDLSCGQTALKVCNATFPPGLVR